MLISPCEDNLIKYSIKECVVKTCYVSSLQMMLRLVVFLSDVLWSSHVIYYLKCLIRKFNSSSMSLYFEMY